MTRRLAALALGTTLLSGAHSDPQSRLPSDPPHLIGKVDLMIGGADEDRAAYIFADVRGLELDTKQRILVADYGTHNVRVYSPAGAFLYAMGRKGQGPGDLLEPCCIAIAPDGQVWVKEFGNHRYSHFTLGPDRATFTGSVRSGANPSGYFDRVAWDPQGRVVDVLSGLGLGSGFVRAFLDSTGRVVSTDTLRDPPADSLSNFKIEKCSANGCGGSVYGQPYGATALRAFGPHGETALAVSSRYAVLWQDAHRNRIALIQQSAEGPALSAREKANADQTIEAISKNTGKSRSAMPFGVPARKAPLRAIGFDLDGRLWVERSVVDGTPHRADVYDHRGVLVAITEWPSDVRLTSLAVRGNVGVGVSLDSLGTNRIVRIRFR